MFNGSDHADSATAARGKATNNFKTVKRLNKFCKGRAIQCMITCAQVRLQIFKAFQNVV